MNEGGIKAYKKYSQTHVINLALSRTDQCFPWSAKPLISSLGNFALPINTPSQCNVVSLDDKFIFIVASLETTP